MAWQCSGSTNSELIENLYTNNLITSPIVKAAMLKVDRAHYTPSPHQAYEDSPQIIGHGATISAPHMHAHACESLLEYLKPGARVLDIGSGSGYLTAVMAELVFRQENEAKDGEGKGKVVGLEHIPQLRDLGERNMRKSSRGKELLEAGQVSFVVGDGRKGYVDETKEGWEYVKSFLVSLFNQEQKCKRITWELWRNSNTFTEVGPKFQLILLPLLFSSFWLKYLLILIQCYSCWCRGREVT